MAERPTPLEMARARRGLTQIELAKVSGISRHTISAIEIRKSGRTTSMLTFGRLARALGVDLEDLLESDEAIA